MVITDFFSLYLEGFVISKKEGYAGVLPELKSEIILKFCC